MSACASVGVYMWEYVRNCVTDCEWKMYEKKKTEKTREWNKQKEVNKVWTKKQTKERTVTRLPGTRSAHLSITWLSYEDVCLSGGTSPMLADDTWPGAPFGGLSKHWGGPRHLRSPHGYLLSGGEASLCNLVRVKPVCARGPLALNSGPWRLTVGSCRSTGHKTLVKH